MAYPLQKICTKTGQPFIVSTEEMAFRKKLGIEGEPTLSPIARFMHLGAFWQHWNFHSRACGKTGKPIISVFGPDCPYPVWHRDEWVRFANPQGADFDETQDVFPQMWAFFQHSPIAHNMVAGNENCEYTDDFWYSKNCYLCHSGVGNEDLKYCYRALRNKNSTYCVFSNDCELCVDVIYSLSCYHLLYGFLCHQCTDSAFLYDCRNCQNCMFCSNLRNKQYYFFNQQLSKEAYVARCAEWDLSKRSVYEKAKQRFCSFVQKETWHRALLIDRCENSSGNFLDECKDCSNCYFLTGPAEDCMNSTRQGEGCKDTLDCVGAAVGTEISYCCSLAQDQCYDNRYCYNTIQCRYAEYCAHCFQCDHCFGCCGLVGKKYYIFNKPYSLDAYKILKAKIIAKMKSSGEFDRFFPGHFAANPYDESWASFYWPLSQDEQKQWGFRLSPVQEKRSAQAMDTASIPDNAGDAKDSLASQIFWDSVAEKLFQIQKADIVFSKKMKIPLPYTYYIRRIQENFRWMPFTGTTRTTSCGKCHQPIQTSWPELFNGRILCEGCYQKEVY